MRVLLVLMVATVSALAQTPLVRLSNTSRPGANDFQIGDRFEILITAAPNQPVSVRTTMHGRTDWGPVIGSTDSSGRWSTTGRFEKSDFGGWDELWTVGSRLAIPDIRFSVNAPCLPGGQVFVTTSGMNTVMTCDTAEGRQTFVTPSSSDPFRTPDGRLVTGRPTEQTPEQYHTEIIQYFITSGREIEAARISLQSAYGGLGDETADLLMKLTGPNALTEAETRNVLALIHGAFEKPESITPSAKDPF